jgi:hypothetical protein
MKSESNGVYEQVKARLIAQEFPGGQRISIEHLADRLVVSHTPIREALVRLAAERIISEVPKAGFFAKELSKSEITELCNLQSLLLQWSLNDAHNGDRAPLRLKPPDLMGEPSKGTSVSPRTAVDVMDDLFVHVSSQSGNADVIQIVRNINDRTHYIRLKDYEVFGDAEDRLPLLCQSYAQLQFDRLRAGLKLFFHERLARLPELIRMLKLGHK